VYLVAPPKKGHPVTPYSTQHPPPTNPKASHHPIVTPGNPTSPYTDRHNSPKPPPAPLETQTLTPISLKEPTLHVRNNAKYQPLLLRG